MDWKLLVKECIAKVNEEDKLISGIFKELFLLLFSLGFWVYRLVHKDKSFPPSI